MSDTCKHGDLPVRFGGCKECVGEAIQAFRLTQMLQLSTIEITFILTNAFPNKESWDSAVEKAKVQFAELVHDSNPKGGTSGQG